VKCVIGSNIVQSQAPESPVAAYVGPFAESLLEQGYASPTIHRQVLLAASFCGWLARRQLLLRGMSSDLVPQYLRYRFRLVRPSRGHAALKHFLEFL
jgi:integrase/recombinase XerD